MNLVDKALKVVVLAEKVVERALPVTNNKKTT